MVNPSRSRYLTKSLFQRACECPRKLAYALSPDFEAKPTSGFLQHLADDGKMIGAYSRLMFPDGVLVDETNSNDAVEKTKSLLLDACNKNETVTIFEGAFRSSSCLIRADILQKTPDGTLKLMEVKAKSYDSMVGRERMVTKKGGIKSQYLKYIQDVAFQKHVIQAAFPDLAVKASLVLPDKAKTNTKIYNLNAMFQADKLDEASRKVILDANEMLVTEVDVDDLVEIVLETQLLLPGSSGKSFGEVVTELISVVELENDKDRLAAFSPPVGNQCARDCEFRTASTNSGFAKCWEQATRLAPTEQESLVVDIYSGGLTIKKLLKAKKYRMSALEPTDLGLTEEGKDTKKKGLGMSRKEKQWLQVKNTDTVVLDRDYLVPEMETWEYPFHFVDFETIAPALPFTANKHPFQTLAFQFSHHTMYQDGTVEHDSEFLYAVPGECPNRPFLDALADSLGDTSGTVFRWGSHENTVLAALLKSEEYDGRNLQTIESLVKDGNRAMVDLMAVAAKGYYVSGSGASSSIKNLLTPTLRVSQTLRDIYSQPSYSGKNFTDTQWWKEETVGGGPCNPYSLLATPNGDGNASDISHGGDAIVAYNALQNSDMDPATRSAITTSLLRYCELDTLAMVMIMQGLQGLLLENDMK